jgi:SWI/SNF-related matrix-associated actin-dependent regulator 1 of chromatin subfamily A
LLNHLNDKKLKFKVVIVDEAHYVKSMKTKRYLETKKISSGAEHIILISGTPTVNRPIELYPLLDMIRPNFMKYYDFAKKFCGARRNDFGGLEVTGATNIKELSILLRSEFMVRRLKRDVLTELPEKLRIPVYLDGSRKSNFLSKLKTLTPQEIVKNSAKLSGELFTEFAEVCELKTKSKEFNEFLDNFMEENEGENIVFFAFHDIMFDHLENYFKDRGMKTIKINGSIHPNKRQELVNEYQNNPEIKIALLSIQAASVGYTLTKANKMIMTELWWNPGTLQQCEDRIHRIGQSKNVQIYYPVFGELDNAMFKMVLTKSIILENILNGEKDDNGNVIPNSFLESLREAA